MPRKKYAGDSETSHDLAADNVIDNKPNTDHVVKTWRRRGPVGALTQDAIDSVCELVAGGVTIPVAATARGFAGVWRNWNRVGKEHVEAGYEAGFEEGQSPYVAWIEGLTEAKAAFEVNMTLTISSMHPQWKAARDILDARIPSRWAAKQQVKVEVKTADEKARELSSDELEAAVLKALAEKNS